MAIERRDMLYNQDRFKENIISIFNSLKIEKDSSEEKSLIPIYDSDKTHIAFLRAISSKDFGFGYEHFIELLAKWGEKNNYWLSSESKC